MVHHPRFYLDTFTHCRRQTCRDIGPLTSEDGNPLLLEREACYEELHSHSRVSRSAQIRSQALHFPE